MSKSHRNEVVREIASMVKDKSLVFIDYQGIDVHDFTQLRKNLQARDSKVKVFKNTLTLRALASLNMDPGEVGKDVFTKMTATAIAESDNFMAASKDILNAEKNKKIKIKGGYFNGGFLDSNLVRKYASVPSRQDLYSILVATLQQVVGNVVFVLEEIKKQKENQKTES